MPSLKGIRRRIGSVRNTQKITRAMKLVSAAKFARAVTAVVAARPYGHAFDAMLEQLVEATGSEVNSPLLATRAERKSLLVVVGTDGGFCGGLNTNLFKAATAFINEKKKEGVTLDLLPWGKRARLYAIKQRLVVLAGREAVLTKPRYELARELADELSKSFVSETYDRIYLAFVEFRSALSQSPRVLCLLPIGRSVANASKAPTGPMLLEPSLNELMDGLLRRAVASRIFRSLLEGSASEHGARMTAMDSATKNASEVQRKLKIQYNRARQAAITKELIEIISGAQAL